MAQEAEDDGAQTFLLTAGEAEATVGYKLRLAQILAFRAFEEKLSDRGRAPRYLGLLAIIRNHPGQPQSRLAEAVALRRSSLVTILDILAGEGLVERRPVRGDRRSNGIWLTKMGSRVVDELLAESRRHDAMLTEGLSQEEVGAALRALDRMILNMRNAEGG
ncbi:MarR family winged helix-turn-helix transcriptional regulator [Jiella sonneratiae]|uniref:Winged helix-turn-helix transcriptional regulator n=1 Tax=Jiella sonneratiae TaxID=2816856 RepID=A0ABS3J1F2_9HYPH|nr:MarR family winged helix-turn-helix transcriptional regulator [Jiella sonneratiae]MBO0902813.1 winged helix-turn-helix transcriptional regulator [Jiella sonneratiae]